MLLLMNWKNTLTKITGVELSLQNYHIRFGQNLNCKKHVNRPLKKPRICDNYEMAKMTSAFKMAFRKFCSPEKNFASSWQLGAGKTLNAADIHSSLKYRGIEN